MAPTPKQPAKSKAAAFEAFDNGALAKDLVKQGYTRTAAYKWRKQWEAENPALPPIEEVEEPPKVGAPTDPHKPSVKRGASITEETAGMILATLFSIWASVSHEELRALTASQKARLQGPFAATLQTIPNPIAELVNTYAPPVSFVTTLVAVVQEQNDMINAKRSKSYDQLAQMERARDAEAERIERARANAAGNGEAADYDVPADKRVSTGVAEPEGGHFEFA